MERRKFRYTAFSTLAHDPSLTCTFQIWFQNRRQNDRRRSKPLQPHELIAHIAKTSTPPTALTPDPSQTPIAEPGAAGSSEVVYVENQGALPPTPSPEESQLEEASQIRNEDVGQPPSAEQHSRESEKSERQATPEPPPNLSPAISPSSGRKRSHSEMVQPAASAATNPAPTKTKEPLKRSSSVRLAMTVDGAVKIRTNNDPTPSPEKDRSLPPGLTEEGKQRRLSRSVSMFDSPTSRNVVPRSVGVLGRSRDHRKWEFYCDKSEDKDLSIQAEAERSGSAVGAINLIRSNSLKGRGLAVPSDPSRGNVRSKDAVRPIKAKLSRAKSSFARLGCPSEVATKGGNKTSQHIRSPSDSDKENWAPGTRMSENPLRRTQPSTNRRPVLQGNETVLFPDTSNIRKKVTIDNKVSPRKEKAHGEVLDCIQGLLSLSQGAWR